MTTHAMCDLETGGRRPGCVIASIGATIMWTSFEGEFSSPDFYLELNTFDQCGLTTDPDTLAWWLAMSPETHERFFGEPTLSKPSLRDGLWQFGLWLGEIADRDLKGEPNLRLWGNGADFDNAILQVAYEAAGLPVPWPFWHNRCYRTLKAMTKEVRMDRQGTHHNALDDAKSQADHARRIVEHMGLSWHDL